MRLRQKLFLIIGGLTVMPLLVIQFWVVDRNERALEDRARREAIASLDKLAAELRTMLDAQTFLVRGLAAVPAVQRFAALISEPGETMPYQERRRELEQFFLNYQAVVPSIQALRVFDGDGNTLVKVKERKVVDPVARLGDGRGYVAYQGGRPFFQRYSSSLGHNEVGISDFELGQVTPDADFCPSMLRYITPLDQDDRRVGYLVVNTWGKRIDAAIANTLGGHETRVMMAELASVGRPDRDGIYLYHRDTAKRFANQTGADHRLSSDLGAEDWHSIRAGPPEGFLRHGKRMLFYHKFRPYEDHDSQWLLVIEKNREEFLGPVFEMRRSIWALLALAVILCLFLAQWSAARLARPVLHLADIITRYANGERLRYEDPRDDEIGRAGRAYNYLTETLARAEDERERAEAVACQAAKMATVGELAAGVAHEINNPLNNMMGLTELIQRSAGEGLPAESLREDLEVLRQEQRRCADIVQGLLDFGRPRAPVLKPVDLVSLVLESIRLLERKARSSRVVLEAAPVRPAPPVPGDPGQLQQVLVNVLLNAIHASPANGTVEVRLEPRGERMVCRVLDRGAGVERDQAGRIFEPFYTTKQDRNGTGLGLSVSYSIIQRHGGEMGARPRPGGGFEVWFSLPVSGAETGTGVSCAGPAARAHG